MSTSTTTENRQFGSSYASHQTPRLPSYYLDYYTKPTIEILTAKEQAEPGYCGRVKNFIFGRAGFGRIKFLGETNVTQGDLKSCIEFLDGKVILNRGKWPVEPKFLNTAEITTINRKFLRKESESRETLIERAKVYRKKYEDQGMKFVSYDPFKGEIKYRVKYVSGSGEIRFYIPNANEKPKTRRSITRMMNDVSL